MKKIVTASQREEKIKELARRIGTVCASFYDKATEAQKETLWKMLEDLENRMIAYRDHQEAWESQLIDVTEKFEGKSRKSEKHEWVDGVFVKKKEISSFDTVMDKAREVFVFVASN